MHVPEDLQRSSKLDHIGLVLDNVKAFLRELADIVRAKGELVVWGVKSIPVLRFQELSEEEVAELVSWSIGLRESRG
jgi:hypothetical protein